MHAHEDVLVVFECKGQSMDEPACVCVHTCVRTISLKEHVIAIIHVYYMYIQAHVNLLLCLAGSCAPDNIHVPVHCERSTLRIHIPART